VGAPSTPTPLVLEKVSEGSTDPCRTGEYPRSRASSRNSSLHPSAVALPPRSNRNPIRSIKLSTKFEFTVRRSTAHLPPHSALLYLSAFCFLLSAFLGSASAARAMLAGQSRPGAPYTSWPARPRHPGRVDAARRATPSWCGGVYATGGRPSDQPVGQSRRIDGPLRWRVDGAGVTINPSLQLLARITVTAHPVCVFGPMAPAVRLHLD